MISEAALQSGQRPQTLTPVVNDADVGISALARSMPDLDRVLDGLVRLDPRTGGGRCPGHGRGRSVPLFRRGGIPDPLLSPALSAQEIEDAVAYLAGLREDAPGSLLPLPLAGEGRGEGGAK